MQDNKSRKLLLINPRNQSRNSSFDNVTMRFMPLSLGIVAALTPPGWDIHLIDENFEKFTYTPADIVAFTSVTSNAFRAYEIAGQYRKNGIQTVIGGIHASMYTDEALEYVDTVVTGEAEGAWPDLIRDFDDGKVKKLYQGGITDIDKIPHARREIFRYPYAYDLVQTSRGCPWGCEFCSVTQMCGKTYRERKIEDVLDELEETTRPLLFFVDDNLINLKKGAEERAINLFKGMVDRGIKKYWMSQAALNFADNEEVLYWAEKSGCSLVLMGIEAETYEALSTVGKKMNMKRGTNSYEKAFRAMHKHGIAILGGIIFGLESDNIDDIYRRGEFIMNSSIDAYQCTILTPLPGTVLFDRFKDQNLIVKNNYPSDWQNYHFMVATSNTPNLTLDEIQFNSHKVWKKIYSKASMRRKLFRSIWNTGSFMSSYWAYASNHNYGRIGLEKVELENVQTKWQKFSEKIYLKVTDKVMWLLYKLAWNKVVSRLYDK